MVYLLSSIISDLTKGLIFFSLFFSPLSTNLNIKPLTLHHDIYILHVYGTEFLFITSATLFRMLKILFSNLFSHNTKLLARYGNLYFISEQIFSCLKISTLNPHLAHIPEIYNYSFHHLSPQYISNQTKLPIIPNS